MHGLPGAAVTVRLSDRPRPDLLDSVPQPPSAAGRWFWASIAPRSSPVRFGQVLCSDPVRLLQACLSPVPSGHRSSAGELEALGQCPASSRCSHPNPRSLREHPRAGTYPHSVSSEVSPLGERFRALLPWAASPLGGRKSESPLPSSGWGRRPLLCGKGAGLRGLWSSQVASPSAEPTRWERAGPRAWGPGILGPPVSRRDPSPHNVEPGERGSPPGRRCGPPTGQGAELSRREGGSPEVQAPWTPLSLPDAADSPEAFFIRLLPSLQSLFPPQGPSCCPGGRFSGLRRAAL